VPAGCWQAIKVSNIKVLIAKMLAFLYLSGRQEFQTETLPTLPFKLRHCPPDCHLVQYGNPDGGPGRQQLCDLGYQTQVMAKLYWLTINLFPKSFWK
jgi:hypothetical protein